MVLRQAQPKSAVAPRPQEIETRESSVVSEDVRHQTPTRLELSLEQITPVLRASIQQHMPPGPYRDFYLWGLDTSNPYHDAWISVIGLKKIVQFTLETIAFPFPDAQIAEFTRYAAPMILYLNFEVVSDNLEFGLSDLGDSDPTYYLRAHLIREFSNAMCKGLTGAPQTAADLLAHEEGVARRISSLHQSLNPGKHLLVADAFLREHPHVSPEDLDGGLMPLLIMNIETCRDLTRAAQGFQSKALISKALYRRYRSAERVFRDQNLNLSHVVSHGAYTILTMPVMAYYLEMVANGLGIFDRWGRAVASGILERTLYQCSVLVRLLNDLGTPVIMQSPAELGSLIADLRHQARYHQGVGNVRGFLRNQVQSGNHRSLLTRIAKDVETGDFNVSLYNLSHVNPLDNALITFGEHLGKLNDIYHRTYDEFEEQLAILTATLGTDQMSKMIRRVVEFHAEMYSNDYRQESGDYAV